MIEFLTCLLCISLALAQENTTESEATTIHTDIVPVQLINIRCRNQDYPYRDGGYKREFVPDEKASWDVPFESYNPPLLTVYQSHKRFLDQDIPSPGFNPKWNAIDYATNRMSFGGEYRVVDNFPLNPRGRTGLRGRGILDRWGPNHNVNIFFTRWKLSSLRGDIILQKGTNLPILQVMVFKSPGINKCGVPGKVMFPGETMFETIKRVYYSGVANFDTMKSLQHELSHLKPAIDLFLEGGGTEIYKGYVDDPRNTDNAWVETIALQYHCRRNDVISRLPLRNRPNGASVVWVSLNDKINWISRHNDFAKCLFVPEFNPNTTENNK